jgi:hypothetical protein
LFVANLIFLYDPPPPSLGAADLTLARQQRMEGQWPKRIYLSFPGR